MIEALWSVEFASNLGIFGSGVVVFETERIFGGDAKYYYLGKFKVKNQAVDADVEVTHYSGEPFSVFGHLNKFNLKVTGRVQVPRMELQGHLVENPNMEIMMRLNKIADLP